MGCENSSGGGMLIGGAAYAGVVTTIGAHPLQFGTNETKRLSIAAGTGNATFSGTIASTKWIQSDGNVFIGINTSYMELQTHSNEIVFGSNSNTTWYVNYRAATGTTVTHYNFLAGNASTYATMNVDVNDTSDRDLKEDIVDIPYGLDAINELRPTKFKWRGKDQLSLGFIAQEIKPILPELVTQDGVDHGDGKTGHMFLKYQGIIAVLTKAIQELSTEVNNLQAQISGSSDFNALKSAVSGSS
jgi:hypothetical protein